MCVCVYIYSGIIQIIRNDIRSYIMFFSRDFVTVNVVQMKLGDLTLHLVLIGAG